MGAGFILYKEDPLQIFTLIPTKKKFLFDLPKGTEDPGEKRLDTALRECFEEAGIQVPIENIEGVIEVDSGRLTIYISPWIEGWVPKINPNPDSGKVEHSGWDWLSPEEFILDCPKWMRSAPKKFKNWYLNFKQ